MEAVSVILSAAWPTAQGLRRPQEGVITVTSEDAAAIVEAGAGKIVPADEAEQQPAPSRRAARRPKASAAPAPEEPKAE